jgi:hypothetical protein
MMTLTTLQLLVRFREEQELLQRRLREVERQLTLLERVRAEEVAESPASPLLPDSHYVEPLPSRRWRRR